MFGADANWGRVLCAIGYSGAHVDVHKVDVFFRSAAGTMSRCAKTAPGVDVFRGGGQKDPARKGDRHPRRPQRTATRRATAWGCDLTYDYVKINGDYRT